MGSVTEYKVRKVGRPVVRDFVEKWHYSGSINGVISDYCFGLYDEGELIGAIIYGKIAMANVWKKYVDNKEDIIELRRLCCIDDTPKNTESYFIGQTLQWLLENTLHKKVISYADPNFGHTGIVYKATNFSMIGQTAPGRVIRYNGDTWHDKTIRTKYKGELKPFARKIKEALEEGRAHYEKTEGKYIYIYDLESRRSKRQEKEIKSQRFKHKNLFEEDFG